MNSSVHFGKNEGSPSFMGARGPAPLRLAPQACGAAGQAGWILTVKLAFFVILGYLRFVSESRQ
jgi:hypothetical protein